MFGKHDWQRLAVREDSECGNDESLRAMFCDATRILQRKSNARPTAMATQPNDPGELRRKLRARAMHSQDRLAVWQRCTLATSRSRSPFASVSLHTQPRLNIKLRFPSRTNRIAIWIPTTVEPPYMDSSSCFQRCEKLVNPATNAPHRSTLPLPLVSVGQRRLCYNMVPLVAASAAPPSSSASMTRLSRPPQP